MPPPAMHVLPPLNPIKIAGMVYLYWLVGHNTAESPWIYLSLVPALLPIRAAVVES